VEIIELFRVIKDEEHLQTQILPPIEDIISRAQQIDISDNRIKELYAKHKPKPKPKQLQTQIKKLKKQTITTNLPPKMEAPLKEEVKFEADLGDENLSSTIVKKKKKKKKKKKANFASELEIL